MQTPSANHYGKTPRRKASGILSEVLLSLTVIIVALISMIAVDIAHNVKVRSELQNAADAASLAGAQDLISASTAGRSDTDALGVAAINSADARYVSDNSPGTTVSSQTQDISGTQPGVVEVNADMTINNYFAKLISHYTDTIGVESSALCYPSVTGVTQGTLFPLAVSIDTTAGHTVPLYESNIGDTVTFYINSQQYANATYTGFTSTANATNINQDMDEILGLTTMQSGTIPAVNIGTSITLMNGVAGTKDLSTGAENTALTDGRTIYLPLISGAAPFNQNRPIVGFIGVKVTSVQPDQSGGKVEIITATITKGIVNGVPGAVGSPTGNQNIDASIQNLSPGMVMLGSQTLSSGTSPSQTTSGPATPSSIVSNFNGTPINSGAIWFNSVINVKNVSPGANSTVYFTNQTIAFTANGQNYNLTLPDSKVIFSPSATTASTTFDTTVNRWETIVPASYNGNVFLGGLPYPVGSGLPGGINPVTWNGNFSTDTPGLTVQWQWAASVYTQLSTDETALGVKPVDSNSLSQYKNSDHAGAPENYLSYMGTGGARGGGGSNYTGSYSATGAATPAVTMSAYAFQTRRTNKLATNFAMPKIVVIEGPRKVPAYPSGG